MNAQNKVKSMILSFMNFDIQKGETPLHIAVQKQNMDIVVALVRSPHIDINKQDLVGTLGKVISSHLGRHYCIDASN